MQQYNIIFSIFLKPQLLELYDYTRISALGKIKKKKSVNVTAIQKILRESDNFRKLVTLLGFSFQIQKDLESVAPNLATILPTPRGKGGKEGSNDSAIPWCGKHLQ